MKATIVAVSIHCNGTADRATITPNRFDSNKTPMLILLDGMDYMLREENLKAMMNKATYSLLTNRPFYMWIGELTIGARRLLGTVAAGFSHGHAEFQWARFS
jgi:hypothetical protein